MREVALIVSGVLIALSLEAMWQYRVDRSDEQALLEEFAIEFQENENTLDRWIVLHQSVASSVEALLGYLESTGEGASVTLPDSSDCTHRKKSDLRSRAEQSGRGRELRPDIAHSLP